MKDTLQFRREDDRIIVLINGEDRHQLENVYGSIVMFNHPVPSWIENFQLFPDARIISSGFCVEDCCPSTWVRIAKTQNTISLHSPHKSIDMSGKQEPCEDFNYVFDKSHFLEICNNLLAELLINTTDRLNEELRKERPNT